MPRFLLFFAGNTVISSRRSENPARAGHPKPDGKRVLSPNCKKACSTNSS